MGVSEERGGAREEDVREKEGVWKVFLAREVDGVGGKGGDAF